MAPHPSKQALKEELCRHLEAELTTLERALDAAREGATHEEAKPENDKDTRALEASYLARGQASRVVELRTGLAEAQALPVGAFGSRPIALGALVTAEERDEEILLLLAPAGGGTRLAQGTVQVVTPKSPLGRALLGKHAGDDCEVALSGKTRALSIVRID